MRPRSTATSFDRPRTPERAFPHGFRATDRLRPEMLLDSQRIDMPPSTLITWPVT